MSRIDFIVHATLYDHGLRFSYDWASEYWMIYTVTFVVFSAATSLMYWLGSAKTARDLRFSLALLATVNILMIGGLQDIMFYILWYGGLPANNIVWWWVPWSHILGTWTSTTQVILASIALMTTGLLWKLVAGKDTSETSHWHADATVQ